MTRTDLESIMLGQKRPPTVCFRLHEMPRIGKLKKTSILVVTYDWELCREMEVTANGMGFLFRVKTNF